MTADLRITIAVRPTAELEARPRLFGALEAAFPARFVPWTTDGPAPAGVLVLHAGPALPTVDELEREGVPVFAVGAHPRREASEAARLAQSPSVDRRLRGVALFDGLAGPRLEVTEREDVLAVAASGVAWTRSRGSVAVHRLRSVLPELGADEVLYSLLSQRGVAAVGLIHFLRALLGEVAWQPPPLRATIVFDDPNLRWRSYGFIDYGELLEHADAHGYHASMAMIPLDAGRAHPRALELFARRPDRLSLNVHGNDHSNQELLAPRDDATSLAMAAQAVMRVARFERRTGLTVDRVMMPPHGLCSTPMTRALGAVGFDGLCAIHPLPWTNDWRSGPVLAGWRPADFVAGCPVIPRMPLSCSPADIALRVFLDHPVVLYGHHQDVAGGLDLLAEAAANVDRLGDVQWTSAGAIARGNAQWRMTGGDVVVRPYARRVEVTPPAGARTLTVAAPQDALDPAALVGWSLPDGMIRAFGATVHPPGAPVVIALHGAADVDPATVHVPAWRPWPKLRRAATETRDRAMPLRRLRTV